ncbi:toll-like receptor 4 [Mercenaria mercenaria]|uniref:toll-like receptor 4 n=1 Tax=Mercenaria mercenaria TaxID=6596 RepID=UPI00234F37F8|nr:toll-like receptor 4 [Mercenaria mercenaria]
MKHLLKLYGIFLIVIRSGLVQTSDKCQTVKLQNETLLECGEGGYAMRCGNKNLDEVPTSYPEPATNESRLCLLDLSRNNFSQLEDRIFVNATNLNPTSVLWLYLQHSYIGYISSNTFQNLSALVYLNLSGNFLTWPDSFGKGVFEPLVSLKDLNVKENKIVSFQGMGSELQYMTQLEGIYAELCSNCSFDKTFTHLRHLQKLSLSGRSENSCNSAVVHNYTFEGVPYLKHLWLAGCNIEQIEANAFSPFRNSLTLLDISNNENLHFKGMNTALYGLRFSPTLKELDVNRIHTLYDYGIRIGESDIENLKTLQVLETLHADLNKIEVFDKRIFYPTFQLPATLRNITLSGNRLTFGKYANFVHNARNITFLDISRQHLNCDPFLESHDEPELTLDHTSGRIKRFSEHDCPCEKRHVVCLPPHLRKVKWRQSFLYVQFEDNVTVCGARALRHLDISFNLITKWKSSIKGLEYLNHLDLSENYCDEVSPGFFDNFENLQHLNISGNSLGKSFDPATCNYSSKIFRKLKHVTKLDLSNNKIARFSHDVFENLTKLQYLNLSSNLLEEWNLTLTKNNSLRQIDLSVNKLTSLPTEFTSYLDTLCRNNCSVVLILSSNPLQCKCETLGFLQWVLSTKLYKKPKNLEIKLPTNVECLLGSYRYNLNKHLRQITEHLEKEECLDKGWVSLTIGSVVSGVLACILSVAICRIVYKNRWKLRYLYYSRNRRYRHAGFERLFENDAFVSYAKSKASLIKNLMVPSLEGQRGLRLWVADRNSVPGTSVAENITHGIYNSRKSVLLIDKDYLKDSWCDYEMNMAHVEAIEAKRKLIILVLMEKIPLENLPISIMSFLRSERSLEYPEHEQDMDTFWTNLADEIMC